jgi:hypothetical protein
VGKRERFLDVDAGSVHIGEAEGLNARHAERRKEGSPCISRKAFLGTFAFIVKNTPASPAQVADLDRPVALKLMATQNGFEFLFLGLCRD